MQPSTIRRLSLWLMIAMLAAGPAMAQDQTPTPPPEPVVNGVVVPQKDIDFAVQQIIAQKAQRGEAVPQAALPEIRDFARSQAIAEELLVQDSRAQGIEVPDQRIEEETARIRSQFDSDEQYRAQLAAMQLTEADLKRRIGRNQAVNMLIGRLVADVQVSDEEAQAFYDANPDFFKTPEQVRASHILIKAAPEADEAQKAEALKKIKDLQKKIKAGEDFAALAQTHSEGPSSVKGGDLNFFGRGQMVKPFEDAAFALQTDEVSDIVETPFGYHLIKTTDRREAGTISFEDAKPRIAQNLKKEKEGQVFRAHLEKIRATADIQNEKVAAPAAPSDSGG